MYRYVYRGFRANFTYDVIPIALFQAQTYVTFATDVQMWNSHIRPVYTSQYRYQSRYHTVPVLIPVPYYMVWYQYR